MELVSAAAKTAGAVVFALALLGTSGGASALVMLTDPDDGSVFLDLYRPTGKFDETALSGFEFLISSRTSPPSIGAAGANGCWVTASIWS